MKERKREKKSNDEWNFVRVRGESHDAMHSHAIGLPFFVNS